jgi:DNA-binding NarL/FixJ family response regulator
LQITPVDAAGRLKDTAMARILLADDHDVIRRGLRDLIERHGGWEVCGEAASGTQVMTKAMELKPDVVILDLNMPGLSSIEIARTIHANLPETELLIFTMHEGEELIRALINAGARGYILKSDSTSQIVAAIEALSEHKPFFTGKVSEAVRDAFMKSVAGGQRKSSPGFLSGREREIIQLIAEGKSNKRISTSLGISVKTVETHRATVMRKLGVNSVVELVHYAVRNKIICP